MGYSLLTILDWGLIAASIFNTIALLWLGLTVLLNAERRSWGTWAAGGGLVFGGAFFAGHTAVVGRVFGALSDEMIFYWRLGWLVLIVAPYLWYVVMAWYSGALRTRREQLRLATASLLGLLAVVLALFIDPLPSYDELARSTEGVADALRGGTLVRLIYPAFGALCILLALRVLRAPAASDRFMGDLARRRARPWLLAASLVLLTIILAIGVGAAWFLDQARAGIFPGLTARGLILLIVFDFIVCMLIAAAVVLIGQAVVAYEIFTGKALPRGELARQWRRILILAGGYSLVLGWSLSAFGIPRQPIYQLLIATLLMTIFVALISWRSASEQAGGLARLRPFVASQHLYDQLIGPGATTDAEPATMFRALCDELLGARVAYLFPLGPLAGMAGPPLALPAHASPPTAAAAALATTLPAAGSSSALPLCLAVAPQDHGGAGWAVPLRSDRGLIGLLLLGEKRDGGVYTQEEVEVARAAGERLIDAQAAAEMARRLVALQRRRLAESQMLDRRTRRVLHDEVLPQIHASLLQIADYQSQGASERSDGALQASIAQLQAVHHQVSDLLHELPPTIGPDLARLGALGALRRAVEADMDGAFDAISWDLPNAAEAAARQLDPLAAEALYYAAREAVRNAARHGRGNTPTRRLSLVVRAAQRQPPRGPPQLELVVEDDGVGIAPGDKELAGSIEVEGGHGLALHSTLLAIMGGAISVASGNGHTCVTLNLPLGRPT